MKVACVPVLLGILISLASPGPLHAQPDGAPSATELQWLHRLGRVAAALPDATDLPVVVCVEADPRLRWSPSGTALDDERQTEALRLRMEACAASNRAASDSQPSTRLVGQLRASLQDRARRLDGLKRAIERCLPPASTPTAGMEALVTCLQSRTGTTLSADQRRAVVLLMTPPAAGSSPP